MHWRVTSSDEDVVGDEDGAEDNDDEFIRKSEVYGAKDIGEKEDNEGKADSDFWVFPTTIFSKNFLLAEYTHSAFNSSLVLTNCSIESAWICSAG